MAKPTERTDWATQGASGSGGADALRTATDTNRWTLGWQTTPSNLPGEQGEKPNLNEQNYWQYAVHQWIQYLEGVTDSAIVPLGGIIGVSTDLTGAFDSASGVVTDGFMLCDGTAIPGSETVSGSTPDLTDSRFLMGSTTAGSTGGANTKDISHVHNMQHIHQLGYTLDSGGFKRNYVYYTASDAYSASTWTAGPATGRDIMNAQASSTFITITAGGGTWLPAVQVGGNRQWFTARPLDSAGSTKDDTGSGGSATQDILPKYYTVKYFMRVS